MADRSERSLTVLSSPSISVDQGRPQPGPRAAGTAILSRLNEQRTYTVTCASCRLAWEFRMGDLPSAHPNPFLYDCPCGTTAMVRLAGARAAVRKPVDLPASVIRPVERAKVTRLATVLDLSARGLRLTTEPIKTISTRELLDIAVLLDDQKKSRIHYRAVVRRVIANGTHLTLGVEFRSLTPAHRAILHGYLRA